VRAASLTPRTGRQGTFSNNLEQTEAAVVRPWWHDRPWKRQISPMASRSADL